MPPFPDQRTAVVTGAGGERGIGRHVARRLAREGWALAVLDVNADAVMSFAEELGADSQQPVLGIAADVADPDSVDAAFTQIDAGLPPVLAQVNLAGIASPHTLFELTPELWRRVLDVNATGTLLMMQAAARRMIDGGRGGRIVNTSSITAYDGGGTFSKTGYAAAKAAILGLTRGGARELGPRGITCNAIVPGPIDTDIMGGPLGDERRAALSVDIPVQRVGQPAEVAGLVNYLVSEEAGFLNGGSYFIDGGKHMV
ncbi:3-oxoacyl-[acyl-carrier-protein] reductase FabG1 [Arthrobacter saudimassiliensis]|uniref:3-oxoacyl-[acyl-carrier-protein] reductase FabG1 n=1 Tax=Arthrobacter saudimassiliensis TaxID=1461584 RepID=A0A078MM35_9MICC|nr:3-oxoacyl-[acyl-carrier-protein] reductase FabG1 [Arthrobacter saudimassiliensis]